jgi:N6-L-threonylcarbamoyladenine synthase
MVQGVGAGGHGLQRKRMAPPLTFLGIETSCDETAAAIVRDAPAGPAILSSAVFDQTALHAPFGGVVPEIAARAHAERIDHAVEAALAAAGVTLADLDGVAVTAGPGLIGGVLSGVMAAKGIALAAGLPLIGVNHLAGHALTPRLTDGLAFPYLMLLVSGGHCQFLRVEGAEAFRRLGGTIDDAPGEAFDKVAKVLGLPQPGGPAVERAAATGDPARFDFPRPLLDREGCDLSFSGLKTAVLRARDGLIAAQGGLREADRADLCAGFQAAVADVLAAKAARALAAGAGITAFAVAGGVAANTMLRARLASTAAAAGVRFVAPPLGLCTDNGAMIAWAGIERYRLGRRDGWDLQARPRWPLDTLAPPLLGAGRKGAKA